MWESSRGWIIMQDTVTVSRCTSDNQNNLWMMLGYASRPVGNLSKTISVLQKDFYFIYSCIWNIYFIQNIFRCILTQPAVFCHSDITRWIGRIQTKCLAVCFISLMTPRSDDKRLFWIERLHNFYSLFLKRLWGWGVGEGHSTPELHENYLEI